MKLASLRSLILWRLLCTYHYLYRGWTPAPLHSTVYRYLFFQEADGPVLLLPLKPMFGSPWDLSPDTLDYGNLKCFSAYSRHGLRDLSPCYPIVYGRQHMGPAFLTPVNNVRKPAGPVPLLPQPMGSSMWNWILSSLPP